MTLEQDSDQVLRQGLIDIGWKPMKESTGFAQSKKRHLNRVRGNGRQNLQLDAANNKTKKSSGENMGDKIEKK